MNKTYNQFCKAYFPRHNIQQIPTDIAESHYKIYKKSGMTLKAWLDHG